MKKFVAFAFVATMVTFAACTSKPAEETEEVETTVIESVEDTSAAADSVASDSTFATDSSAAQ